MKITIIALGVPAPGGSKSAYPFHKKDGTLGVRVTDAAGKRNKTWRKTVALAGAQVMADNGLTEPFTGPLFVTMNFFMPRPKSHYGTGRNKDRLKASAPEHHTVKPDLTKLIRSTEDALTGIVWHDDSQIVEQVCTKVYGPDPGCSITVETAT